MRLVVFGATGRTGQDLVTRALGHGHKVTAFARRPEELDDRRADLRIVQGDITDAAAGAATVEAQDAVVSTLGSAKPWRHTPAIVRGVAVIIAAAKTAGVQRFVYQSALGVGESRYAVRGTVLGLMIPLMLKKAYEDHAVDEQALRDSGLGVDDRSPDAPQQWTRDGPVEKRSGGEGPLPLRPHRADGRRRLPLEHA